MSTIHKFKQENDYYILDVNSGAIHVVDELVYDIVGQDSLMSKKYILDKYREKYTEEEINEVYEEVNELIKEELLYSKDLYEDIGLKAGEGESYIKALCLNIAHDCNLRCKYCFADEGEYKGKRELMTADIGKKAIDFVIKNSGPRNHIEVDLFGGEPLIAFDTVKEIVEYAKKEEKKHNKVIRFTMTTNGTLLNDEIMKYIDENMGNIVLSIDGRKEVNDRVRITRDNKGSYDKILPKIKSMVKMRDKDKQYYVRGTFTRENLDFFNDIMHLVNEGFDEVSIEPVVLPEGHPLSLREEDLPKIFKEYDKLCSEMIKAKKKERILSFITLI
ncbi:transcriptional regulatory protein [Clostridium tetani]|nr:transcriptional regulatory protein [Clostridium tetani]